MAGLLQGNLRQCAPGGRPVQGSCALKLQMRAYAAAHAWPAPTILYTDGPGATGAKTRPLLVRQQERKG